MDNTGLHVIGIISLNLAPALDIWKIRFLFVAYILIMTNRRLLNYALIGLDYVEVLLDVQVWHRMKIQGQVCGYNNEWVGVHTDWNQLSLVLK